MSAPDARLLLIHVVSLLLLDNGDGLAEHLQDLVEWVPVGESHGHTRDADRMDFVRSEQELRACLLANIARGLLRHLEKAQALLRAFLHVGLLLDKSSGACRGRVNLAEGRERGVAVQDGDRFGDGGLLAGTELVPLLELLRLCRAAVRKRRKELLVIRMLIEQGAQIFSHFGRDRWT